MVFEIIFETISSAIWESSLLAIKDLRTVSNELSTFSKGSTVWFSDTFSK